MPTVVLYAHPDRWTIGAEFPPEERARMRKALLGFAGEWLHSRGRVRIAASGSGTVEESAEQREALARWNARDSKLTPEVLEGALDAVLCGALWDSPEFRRAESTLRFHRAWRIVLELTNAARERELDLLSARWGLLKRPR